MSDAFRQQFLSLALRQQALQFGQFTLKSGRLSPYFFNAGRFDSGSAMLALGRYYASAITAADLEFDMIFGPAYKGIPLATTLVCAFAEQHDRDIPFAFDRKEAKNHGEGGKLVGAPLQGRVLIVDDVISAGTSIRYSADLVRQHGATPAGVAIALDRMEQGRKGKSAVAEVSEDLGLPVVSIATLDDLVTFADEHDQVQKHAAAVREYRAKYGT